MAKPQRRNRGPRKQEPKEYDEEVIQLDRVTRVVKGGRRLRFRATVAIGNRKGKVGVGVAKSNEVVGAIKKAVTKAKQNLIIVPITKDDTIPHRIQSKFKASKILLIPAGPGTGIIAGGATRRIIELSGVKNILSKTLGSPNKLNNSKATIEALKALRARPENEFKKEDEKKPEAKTEAPPAKKPASKPPMPPKPAPKK
ncbi:30S ribosomal protein S5 [Candidatus Peregrinibacteria bacterium]|jgi:small subunit ribosomal protein S5|nr:30S ribosomal protein S5 [Candidatus Peregrinibacteria bacterium]MBT7484439.1 30S ribosomal protein S5 [Candidatus Peregrinibacteria bacterium]MBT7703704.1 30S ribosomal protein S5 [Candidatus Peregrinibacteria bacterium]